MSKEETPLDWSEIQTRYADVPGEEGIALRQQHYGPFFLRFGRGVRISESCRFFSPERIVLEDDTRINIGGLFYGSGGLVIGRHARIGPRCFIHSANHDMSADDPRAFFERGYDYRQTTIGDNALISANVSILPGTRLGSCSFVACAAVVVGAEYPGNSKLFGIPARNGPVSKAVSMAKAAPALAFLVPKARPDLSDAADLLCEVLGLPQVVCLNESETVPSTVAVMLCFGEAEPGPEAQAEIWRLASGPIRLDATQCLRLPDGKDISLALSRSLVTRAVPARGAPAAVRLSDVGYWLHARLFKRSDPMPEGEFREWLVALSLLEWPEEKQRRVLKQLRNRCPEGLSLNVQTDAAIVDDAVEDWLNCSLRFSASWASANQGSRWDRLRQSLRSLFSRRKTLPGVRFTRDKALARPVDLVWRAASVTQQQERAELQELAAEIATHCESSLQWVSVGLAAHLLDLPDVVVQAKEALASDERHPPRGGLLYQLPGRPQLLLSPLYAVWVLLIESEERQVPSDFMIPLSSRQDLDWRGFSGEGDWSLGEARLIDEGECKISEDLLLNWLLLQTAPCSVDSCLELIPEAYTPVVARLEEAWLALLAQLLHRNGQPLIQLCPWPAAYRAALSLRYDIDRPILPTRLRQLVSIQAREANAPLGSWYSRAGDDSYADSLAFNIAIGLQESGVHVESLDEVAVGYGVTHHSAPTSVYWQGDHTTRCLAERAAAYGEFHASALSTPRRAWLAAGTPEDGLGCRAEVMLTALHFPLEGGTDDHDLTYFDQLLPAFLERLSSGGHAIIGSHPDLDQGLLKMIFEREAAALQDVWMAPVAEVIRRWREVMTPGTVSMATGPDGEVGIISDEAMSDVRLVVYEASGEIRQIVLQLLPGMLRPLNALQEESKGVREGGPNKEAFAVGRLFRNFLKRIRARKMISTAFPWTYKIVAKALAGMTHPTDAAGRNADH